MEIYGLQKTTLLDYPGHVAATIFTGGCNFRCPFCHNKDLVLNPSTLQSISQEEIYSFLEKRKNILSGICITGGEPTMQKDLASFLEPIKEMGYLIKLDTNGSSPQTIQELNQKQLINFVAMDIKSSLENYKKVSGVSSIDLNAIQASVEYIKTCGISYEFRTTVVKELHQKEDFISISSWLSGSNAYFLQNFKDNENTISTGYSSYSLQVMEEFLDILKVTIPNTSIRGTN